MARRRRKAEIVVLPGVERRDLGEAVSSEDVLHGALESGLTDVVVVGRDRTGEFRVASASGDVDRVVGLLMRAVALLSGSGVVSEAVPEDEAG